MTIQYENDTYAPLPPVHTGYALKLSLADLLDGFSDDSGFGLEIDTSSIVVTQGLAAGTAAVSDTIVTLSLSEGGAGVVQLNYVVHSDSGETFTVTRTLDLDFGNADPTFDGDTNLGRYWGSSSFDITYGDLVARFSDSDGDHLSFLVRGQLLDSNDSASVLIALPSYVSGGGALDVTAFDAYGGRLTATLNYSYNNIGYPYEDTYFPPDNTAPVRSGTPAVLDDGTEDVLYHITRDQLMAGFTDDKTPLENLFAVSGSSNHGGLEDDGAGGYFLDPAPDYYGPVTISYKVSDGSLSSNAYNLTFNLTPVNDAPALIRPQAALPEGSDTVAYTISQAQLLTGFGDVDDTLLTAADVVADHGTAKRNDDGSYTVTPVAGYTGKVTLSYTVKDPHAASLAATLSYNVAHVNHAPVLTGAQAVLANGVEDVSYSITEADLLKGFVDPDGDVPLSVGAVTANHGTVKDNGDRTWTVTPASNYFGTMTLNFSVRDVKGLGTSAVQSYLVSAVNDAPTFTGSKAVLPQGQENVVYSLRLSDLIAGYSDVDDATATLKATNLISSQGKVVDNNNGTFAFMPNAGFDGTVMLSYRVEDPHGAGVDATQSFLLTGVNDKPRFAGSLVPYFPISESDLIDSNTMPDPNGHPTSGRHVTDVTVDFGRVVINDDGTFGTFVDLGHFLSGLFGGLFQVKFTFVVHYTDGSTSQGSATKPIPTHDTRTDPTTYIAAQATLADGREDTPVLFNDDDLLKNFTDPEGGRLSISGLTATHGIIDTVAGGYVFRPDADYNGKVVFTYTVVDTGGLGQLASQTFFLAPVNDAPTGSPTTVLKNLSPGGTLSVSKSDLLAGFGDVDGDTLSVTGLGFDHGTVAGNGSGWTVTADAGYFGAAHLNYTVSDGHGGTQAAQETFYVLPTEIAGAETVVNTTTKGNQYGVNITALNAGGWLVTWTDQSGMGADTSGSSIRGRLYAADGTAVGADFQINAVAQDYQTVPNVTGLKNGGFVATWTDAGTTVSDVKMRIFGAAGNVVLDESVVNGKTANAQDHQTVAGLSNGGFVVTWQDASHSSSFGDTSDTGIMAKVFKADGTPVKEFLVNTYTRGGQTVPTVAAFADGRFIVTWTDKSQALDDKDSDAIMGKIFKADGSMWKDQFQVNKNYDGTQTYSEVTALVHGGFVVTWQDATHGDAADGTASIKMKVFDAAGNGLPADEQLVNTNAAGNQMHPVVAALSDGGFVIAWYDQSKTLGDDSSDSIKAQRFNDSGDKVGTEFLVNTTTQGGQEEPTITALADGGFVISWWGDVGDGTLDIYQKVYHPNHAPVLSGTMASLGNGIEDHMLTLKAADLLAGFSDSDHDRLSVTGVSSDHGVIGTAGGDFTLSPQAGFTGDITLSYTVSDGQGGSTKTSRIIHFDPKNHAPILTGSVFKFDDAYKNTDFGFTAAQLVQGYRDPDGDPIKVTAVFADGDKVVDNGDGTFVLKPRSHEKGTILSTEVRYVALTENDLNDNGDGTFTLADPPFNADEHLGYYLYADVAPMRVTVLRIYENAATHEILADARVGTETYTVGLAQLYSGDNYITYDTTPVLDNYTGPVTLHVRISDGRPEGDLTFDRVINFVVPPNFVNGDDGNNVLLGTSGNDKMFGLGGNDILDGRAGADTMIGGAGNDTYSVENLGDVVTELLNGGADTVKTSLANYTLADNVENLILTGTASINGSGNELANVLTGNGAKNLLTGGAGDDILDGGVGADTMIGGLGNDSYSVENVGDVVTELANEGIDTVKTNLAAYTLAATLENLTLTGSANANGTGNSLSNGMTGNAGNNVLIGGAGDDTLQGNAGDDLLNGGTGADRMAGGLGNDTYQLGVTDTIIEQADAGIDTVLSSLAVYGLGATLENLTLIGSAVTGNGNGLDNIITGNVLANLLQGGDGRDTINGMAGDDTINGGTGADVLSGGAGNDVFLYRALADSPSSRRDLITDFAAGDKMDLHLIDADTSTAGDQAFHQVVAFGHHAGELVLTFEAGANRTLLTVDVDGDAVSDLFVYMTGSHTSAADWLL